MIRTDGDRLIEKGGAAGSQTSEIRVDASVIDSTLRSSIRYTKDLRRFFDEDPFVVEYDISIEDVPQGILSIPVLANVCPVAWATGADVRIPVVDRRFLDSLRTVESVLCGMYPQFMTGGRVIAENVTDTTSRREAASNAGLLFTGGVDSLATYARHQDEDPELINVQGWVVDIDDTDRWAAVKDVINDYGQRLGADTRFVRSNMLRTLNTAMLTAEFDRYYDGGWYSAVGCGIGLAGLCAPLAAARDMAQLYVGATLWEGMAVPDFLDHWDGRAMPWGSHPDIDENGAWGQTNVIHDAFELNRQERIEVVAEFVRTQQSNLPVRSCGKSTIGANCNRCEKCVRTAFGLALAGLNPNHHGFDLDHDSFDYAIKQFERGAWLEDSHAAYYWYYFKQHVSPDQDFPLDGVDRFLQWLQDADFDSMTGMDDSDRLWKAVLRYTPYPVYSTVRSLYRPLTGNKP